VKGVLGHQRRGRSRNGRPCWSGPSAGLMGQRRRRSSADPGRLGRRPSVTVPETQTEEHVTLPG
jgi:hypothetical protein